MAVVLSADEKRILVEIADKDEKTPAGQDRSFYLIPRSYGESLPTLSHSFLPWRTEVSEGVLGALADAGFLRRLKLDADMLWFEITELGRRYAQRLRSGDSEPMEGEEAQGFPFQQINIHPGGSMNTANVHGNITGSVVNMQSILTHVTQTIGTMPSGDDSEKAELATLIGQLREQLNQVPEIAPALDDDANLVSRRVEELINEASEKVLDKPEIESRVNRLKAAAATFQLALPAVITTVEQIGSLVRKIVQ